VQASCPQCGQVLQASQQADLEPLLLQAQQRLSDLQDDAMRRALAALPDVALQRVADTTQRPDHRAAAARADARWWQRWGLIAGGFGLALLVTWCNAR
jgi:hypothetical protein